jgi:hypothetical protein
MLNGYLDYRRSVLLVRKGPLSQNYDSSNDQVNKGKLITRRIVTSLCVIAIEASAADYRVCVAATADMVFGECYKP